MIEKNTLVRIKADDGFRGETGRVTMLPEETEDGRYEVLIGGETWLFTEQELQELSVGTKILIEVEIRKFLGDESMMIAGGWMPLSRIVKVLE